MRFDVTKWKEVLAVSALVVTGIVGTSVGASLRKVESRNPAPVESVKQNVFVSPAKAGIALEEAMKTGDTGALALILGSPMKALLTTGDAASDKTAMQEFSDKYAQMNRWVKMSDGTRVLYIGADNFEFPAPLAKNAAGLWYFDGVAGAQEVRARDIGRNELLAIDACAALADAQQAYSDFSGGSYAQQIISTEGKQDGLYWQGTEAASPLAQISRLPKSVASLMVEPLRIDGYTFRILTAQGDDAPGGAMNYIVDGKMIGGFAILATPLKYGETGIMTFMISREGLVYESDMGPDTAKTAASIQAYNPDDKWSPID